MGNKNILFLESLNKNIQNNSFFNSADWRNYFTRMAGRESSYRSDAYNPSGAYGYFLLMPYNRRGKDIDTQFNDVFDLTLLHLQLLSANMTELDYRKAELYGIDMYGLAAGAHLGGPGGVLRVLRGKGNPKDSNGTSVLLYMLEFSGTQDPNNVIYGDLNEYFALPQEELNYEIPDILSSTEEDLNVLNADLDGLDDWINYIINVERKTPEYKQKLLEYNEAIARYKALGGPINTNNPILNFSLFKGQLPVVRYSYGGELDDSVIPSSNSVKPNLFYDGGDTMTSQFLDQVLADREANLLRNEELAALYNFSPLAISDILLGKDVNVYTPDVVVTGKAPSVGFYPYGYRTVDKFYLDNPSGLMEDVGSFVPFVGDGIEIGNIGLDLYKGNYNQAVVGLGLMALPNILEKPMKYVGRKLHNLYNTFLNVKTIPQITLENAVNITPELWTATQDAAIARGDMVEAQRLRDLHFKVSAPNTVASVNGQPLQLYHGTDAAFNAFDISKYGNTDGGTFGRGVYTTPVKEYAELYGKNNMPLYMKLDNPRDYRNLSIGDLMAEKFAFGDDFSTGNGIDGVIGRPSWKGFKGLEEWVSHNPKNIKSSLPVTYDDNGVRIPLGERDNFNINDIRYGFIPPVAAGLGLSLYNLDNSMLHSLGGPLNKFEEGGNTDDTKYQAFIKDLKKYAPNLAAPSEDYNMRRYWELRGKPSNWEEALRDFNYLYNVKEDPMFTLEGDGFYHAKSVAPNLNTGIIEFMKSADHPTVKYELNWYDNGDETGPNGLRIPSFEGFKSSLDFKQNYELKYSPIENKYYYVPRANKKVGGGGLKEVVSDVGTFLAHPTDSELINLGLSYMPFFGSAMDIGTAIEDPTWENTGTALASVGLDLLGGSLIKGAYKTYKHAKKVKLLEEALELSSKKASLLSNLKKKSSKVSHKKMNSLAERRSEVTNIQNELERLRDNANFKDWQIYWNNQPVDLTPVINKKTVYGTDAFLNTLNQYRQYNE